MDYIRLNEGLGGNYKLIPANSDIWDYIKNNEKDYYTSIFQYNEAHYKQWKETHSLSGIKDVFTRKLVFDFDDADNLDRAKKDALELVSRLMHNGIEPDVIQIAFSGNKGFCVELETTTEFTPEEFKTLTFALASDLPTFDRVVNDPQRIIRVVGTKHNISKLYKFPLTANQLSEFEIKQIKQLASSLDNLDREVIEKWKEVKLPEAILSMKYVPTKEKKAELALVPHQLNVALKPKWLTEAKYALQEGYFEEGERNTACMILASTYRNQGFSQEIAYNMIKATLRLRSQRMGLDDYDRNELWKTVIEPVYSPHWKGGQYAYETTPLLQDVTKRLGLTPPTDNEFPLVPVGNVTDLFRRFAKDIDKNTIKLGIPMIDSKVKITTSMLVGLLAAPSAGKTSVSLSILNSASKDGIKSAFYSLDMGAPLVYQRLIQRHTSYSGNHIFDLYKNDSEEIDKIEETLDKEYSNVKFCFKSGISVEDMREFVISENEKTGNKIRLLVVDYLECIAGPYSDPTANTAMIAQKLKDLANELELCIILLLQPQKHAGDPSSELLSYRNIKGSSAIEQAASVVFTLWRPGFSAKNPKEDKFITVAAVKNRMGNLACFDFSWNGLTSEIRELELDEVEELDALRKRKANEKAQSENDL